MKKLLLFLLFCLVLAPAAYAGRSIYLDFEDKESYIIPMYKGDRIYFDFENDNHTVILDEIKPNRIELDIFLYQNTKFNKHTPEYVFLDLEHNIKLDINKDMYFDFLIELEDFDPDKAILKITKVYEEKNSEVLSNNDIENKQKFYKNKNFLIIAGGLLFVIILIYFINSYLRKQKGVYF